MTYESINDISLRGHRPLASRRHAIDRDIDLRLLRIDVVNRILLAGEDIHASAIIGRETRLLRRALARELHGCQHFLLAQVRIDHRFLWDVVEAPTGQHAPVKIPTRERDAVGARRAVPDLGLVPTVNQTPVETANVLLVGTHDAGIEETADHTPIIQIHRQNGAIRALIRNKRIPILTPKGIVNPHIISVHPICQILLRNGIRAAHRPVPVEGDDFGAALDGVATWVRVGGDAGVDDPELAEAVEDDVLHVDEAGAGVLVRGAVLPGGGRPGLFGVEGGAFYHVVGRGSARRMSECLVEKSDGGFRKMR